MSRAEIANHARLKSLALAWARAQGFGRAACEVRVPRSGFRADVAAWSEATGRTAVFECKQARADFLKDAHDERQTRARLAAVIERRQGIEQLLATHCPQLCRGEALWPEFDTWDFSALEHTTYRRVRKELATLQRRVGGGTKFARMVRYRCADFLFLVLEEHLHADAEIPTGWGVLVRKGETLELVRAAAACDPSEAQRSALARAVGGKLGLGAGAPESRPAEAPLLQFELSA